MVFDVLSVGAPGQNKKEAAFSIDDAKKSFKKKCVHVHMPHSLSAKSRAVISLSLCLSCVCARAYVYVYRFQEKTGNSWENRANFVKHPGKYDLVEISYDSEEEKEEEEEEKPVR